MGFTQKSRIWTWFRRSSFLCILRSGIWFAPTMMISSKSSLLRTRCRNSHKAWCRTYATRSLRGTDQHNQLPLLPTSPLVESQFLTFENVSVNTSTLTWSTAYNGIQSTCLELSLQSCFHLALGLHPGLMLLCDTVALLRWFLLSTFRLLSYTLSSSSDAGTVVSFIPLSKWCSVDLNDGRFG